MIVFISHPYTGLSEQNVQLLISQAKIDIQKRLPNTRVIFIDGCQEDISYLEGLGTVIKDYFTQIDCIYFAKGWEKSTGCIIERTIAELCHIPYFSYDKADGTFLV